MSIKKYILICLFSLLLPVTFGHAEDIDIYDANSGTSSNPNVLLILDNSSDWARNNQDWPRDSTAPAGCGNSCNSTQGYYELKAIKTMIDGLVSSYGDSNGNVPINLGLQMFTKTNATPNGSYIRSAVVPMTAANRAALISKIDAIILDMNGETAGSSVQYSAALFDAFKYFGGYTNPANATANAQPAGVTSTSPAYSGVPLFGKNYWGGVNQNTEDASAYNGSSFNSPTVESCGRNYLIFIGNSLSAAETNQENWGSVLAALINPSNPASTVSQFSLNSYTCSNLTSFGNNNLLNSGLGCVSALLCSTTLTSALTSNLIANTTDTLYQCNPTSTCGDNLALQKCTLTSTGQPSGNATGRFADEYADFLYNTDVSETPGQQNITTYTIDVYRKSQNQNQTELLRNMAKYGRGKYFGASDLTQISKAFDIILSEIQSVNSVFASSSLPISANTQGTYLNQVFVGMFRPETTTTPRWYGNLKQYQLQFFGSILRMADFSNPPIQAISPETGFFTPCANSAWTSDTGNYWQFSPNSAGLCNAATKFSDAPDGATVEKGGAAQRLRGVTSTGTSTNYSTRALKTCDASNCTASSPLTDFDTSNSTLTAAALGVPEGQEAATINWVRGQDVDDENNNAIFNEVRPSVHGGVVHSQPAVVDYGSSSYGVVSYYGADDGVLHAVNGNQTSTAGNEYWGFIAPETYSKLKRLKQNSPIIKFPTTATSISPAPQPKDYFFDGSIGVFQRSSTVWIYPTMRRGGRAIYAFDVTNPTSPVLKWRRGCYTNSTANDTSTNALCDIGWTEIGQTWSKPQIAYLSGYVDSSSNPKPVLVFGGGYDTCEDVDDQTRCTSTPRKGANIWFVDADTGTVIRRYPTSHSVPGDITLLTDTSGNLTYAYAADTGGYIYRINVGAYDGTTFDSVWTSNSAATNITIASMSETNQERKFLFGPDVIVYRGYNAVAIGSGDREHPLITDYPCEKFGTTGTGVKNQFYVIKDRPTGYPTTPITPSNLTDVTTNFAITESAISNSGLRFDLVNVSASTTLRCEQAVNKPLTIGGVIYFGTNAPKSPTETTASCGINLGNSRGYAVDFVTGAPILTNSRSVINKGGGLPPSPVGGIVDIGGKKVPFCIGCVDTTPTDQGTSTGERTDGRDKDSSKIDINALGPRKRLYWYLEAD